jgi:hypothetical protein
MTRSLTILAIIIIIVGAAIIINRTFFTERVELPKGGETVEETIVVKDGEVVDMTKESLEKENSGVFETKEIMVTDGVRHSVPLEEILSGGPPKDGIPSIDEPKFVSISEANDWLEDNDPGIAVSLDGVNRFYPYQILVWHEIVNDTVGGQRILVSYCPLCLTGFVFDPWVKGERVEFGTSGNLWQSNLVMYDRKTDSLWAQILGEAIVGEMTGTKLKKIPSDQVLYGNWKEKFPSGEVLSQDTGALKFYGTKPYGDYFSATDFSLTLVKNIDERLPTDSFIFGVVIDGKVKAYHIEAVKTKGEVRDSFQGTNLILKHDKELDVVRVYKILPDGGEERINPFSSFWFSWAAVHPETELYE